MTCLVDEKHGKEILLMEYQMENGHDIMKHMNWKKENILMEKKMENGQKYL